ncbi:FUSC family protein [Kocuria dechangensis]|uniref:FUSC family protein n=1 Tax=Kocuria dechangensis TaxID=1176249 RepID=UPI0016633D07|nr:FUSC family protein [Kocuria dechangensis]
MSTLRNFFALHPAQRDHLPAARIALSVAVPLVAVMAAGRADLAIYVAFGAFTSIYARLEPTRARARHQSQAGVLLTLCVALGALLSGAPEAVVLAVTAVLAGLGAMAAAYWTLRPAGSVFFIFAVGAIGSLEDAAPVWQAAALAAASAGFSVALGLASRWAGEGVTGPVAPVPEHHGLSTGQLWAHGGRFLAATSVAGALGMASGLSHSYWAMGAAAAPIAAPDLEARMQRGAHRMVGTLGGVGVTAAVLSVPLQQWHMVALVILFQFLAEMFVGRNYSLALLFITPLALLMTQLAAPSAPGELLQARAVETVTGAVCGLAVVHLTRSAAERGLSGPSRRGRRPGAPDPRGPRRTPPAPRG